MNTLYGYPAQLILTIGNEQVEIPRWQRMSGPFPALDSQAIAEQVERVLARQRTGRPSWDATKDDYVPREVADALADFIEKKVPGAEVFRRGSWMVVT